VSAEPGALPHARLSSDRTRALCGRPPCRGVFGRIEDWTTVGAPDIGRTLQFPDAAWYRDGEGTYRRAKRATVREQRHSWFGLPAPEPGLRRGRFTEGLTGDDRGRQTRIFADPAHLPAPAVCARCSRTSILDAGTLELGSAAMTLDEPV